MILEQLNLQQFRSYSQQTISFSPQLTVLVGPNTAGKTNILEALYMMTTGKSFRADMDREVIRWGSDIARITVRFHGLQDMEVLELVLTHGIVSGQKAPVKKYLVNGISRRGLDFVGNLRSVLFWPEDLELVTDSPSIRRRYLDSVLVQVDREYRRNLLSYERGLRQRNKLLDDVKEGKAFRHQLLFWDQLLIKAGAYITDARMEYIRSVNEYEVTGCAYTIDYDKSVISVKRLEQYVNEEVAAGSTLVGPHRDDFVFNKKQVTRDKSQEELSVSKYGSRGEQRLAVLWVKLAELSYIEKQTGERPILLLDDIFSEFDEAHRRLVFDIIGKQQTIITSAEQGIVDIMKSVGSTHMHVIQLPFVS